MMVINKKLKIIVIIGWGRLTYRISQNKRICIWHYCLTHISNTRIVRASKLVNSIDLNIGKEYDPIEILVDLDNLYASNVVDHKDSIFDNISIMPDVIAYQTTDIHIFDKLYISCIANKSTRTIRRDTNMTSTTNILAKAYVHL